MADRPYTDVERVRNFIRPRHADGPFGEREPHAYASVAGCASCEALAALDRISDRLSEAEKNIAARDSVIQVAHQACDEAGFPPMPEDWGTLGGRISRGHHEAEARVSEANKRARERSATAWTLAQELTTANRRLSKYERLERALRTIANMPYHDAAICARAALSGREDV